MKIIFVFVVLFLTLSTNASVCDTLGFKVNVPKISKADDRAVGIEIRFDSINKRSNQLVIDCVLLTEKKFSKPKANQTKSINSLTENSSHLIPCSVFQSANLADIYEVIQFVNHSRKTLNGKLLV